MKRRLNREFTTRESITILVLVIIVMLICYFRLFLKPVNNAIETAKYEQQALEVERDAAIQRVQNLQSMEANLADIQGDSSAAIMGSYNNSKEEIKIINDALEGVTSYDLSFEDVTRDGDLIRRSFDLRFNAESYDTAENVLRKIASSQYRCLISDISINSKASNVKTSTVSVSVTATFYETMVGGQPDSGLPEDTDTGIDTDPVDVNVTEYNL